MHVLVVKWHLCMFGQTNSKKRKGCTLVGTNIQLQYQKQPHHNHNFQCLRFMFANYHICVVLRSIVCHISGWNCLKIMHKFKHTYILVARN